MRQLLIAVGGGGDAITAAALAGPLGLDRPPVTMTYSWDRLLIDPLPGPRSAAEFTGLRQVTPHVTQITVSTAPIAPAGSSLPRLASQLPGQLLLLDASGGAREMATQIREAATCFHADSLVAVDVGGDSLTTGTDLELRSPLADQLALAACLRSGLPTTLVIAAAGIDGELAIDTLNERLRSFSAGSLGHLSTDDLASVAPILRWHPSEATGLLAAATLGLRGTVEVRDAGDQVQLTDDTPTLHTLELEAIKSSIPAAKLVDSTSLDEAESWIRDLTGISELRYEAAKAERVAGRRPYWPTEADLPQLDAYSNEAARRGADFISMRRLAELIGVSTLDAFAALCELLEAHRPQRFAVGAYRVHTVRQPAHT